MAVGYHYIVDKDGVPKLLSATDDAGNQSEPVPGDPPPSDLVQPDTSDLAELQAAIVKLRIGSLVRMIIAYMVTHVVYFGDRLRTPKELLPSKDTNMIEQMI